MKRVSLTLRCDLAVLAAWGVLSAPWATAQTAGPPQGSAPGQAATGTLHLRGTVVDGVTGKAIARALVISNDRRLATLTNNEGAFALEVTLEPGLSEAAGARGVAFAQPGQIYLTAQRPGYLSQQIRPARVPLDASAEAGPIQLKLMPAAVVAGHVSDARNEAARHVPVELLLHSVNNGERTWSPVGTHRTQADGSFRFTDLNPGEYTVMTEEWRGEQPLPPGRDAVTEQYPPAFLGDASDLSSAGKLGVHFGETMQADLHLRTATYYPVSVPVTGSVDGFVNVRFTGGEGLTGFHLSYIGNRHAVEGSLPNGDYGLELTGYPSASRRQPGPQHGQAPERSYGVTSLHVAGAAVHAAPVALVAPAPIAVRVHREFEGKDVPQHLQTRVYLQPVEQGQPFVTASNEEGGGDEMMLPGAAPGQYSVHVEPNYGYAAQVLCGGADLRAEKLTVSSGGSQPIDIVLRDDTATVDGTLQAGSARGGAGAEANGTGQPSAFIVLTPVHGDGMFTMAGTGPDGRFSLQNVAPGSYRLFAIDTGLWDSPYRDPEALRTLADKGIALNVTAHGRLQVEAPMLDAAALEAK